MKLPLLRPILERSIQDEQMINIVISLDFTKYHNTKLDEEFISHVVQGLLKSFPGIKSSGKYFSDVTNGVIKMSIKSSPTFAYGGSNEISEIIEDEIKNIYTQLSAEHEKFVGYLTGHNIKVDFHSQTINTDSYNIIDNGDDTDGVSRKL